VLCIPFSSRVNRYFLFVGFTTLFGFPFTFILSNFIFLSFSQCVTKIYFTLYIISRIFSSLLSGGQNVANKQTNNQTNFETKTLHPLNLIESRQAEVSRGEPR
jgi:hypothetical protein